jgi:hypothetical protein
VKRGAFLVAVFTAFVSCGTVHADLNDGLVAYYPFNGNATDESGNGNHGTVVDAKPTADRDGIPNRAYNFDGVGDHINCGDDTSLDLTTDLSIVAWINVSSLSEGGRIVCKVGQGGGYEIFVFENELSFATNYYLRRSLSLPENSENNWVFIAVTLDQSLPEPKLRVYFNDEYDESGWYGGAIGTNTEELFVGAQYGSQSFFHGAIDDVRIYNRTLSEDEVLSLYGVVTLPVADAGSDQAVVYEVTLDGSGSFKDGGTIESWDWILVHRTNPASNRTASGVNPTVSNLAHGFYDVTLTVRDDAASTAEDTCLIASLGEWGIGGGQKLGLAEVIQILQAMGGIQP